MRTWFAIIVIFLEVSTLAICQPANDDCANALSLTLNAFDPVCSNATAGTTASATPSVFPPSCVIAAQADDDVWYQFTATSSSIIFRLNSATLIPSGNATISLAIYESACPTSTSSFICVQSGFTGNGYQIYTGFTIGNTYYLRIWNTSTTNDMNFNFCLQEVPAPPTNDNCSGAIHLNMETLATDCSNTTTVSTIGATASSPSVSCTTNDNNDDVWYYFIPTSASVVIRAENVDNYFSTTAPFVSFAVYINDCVQPANQIFCDQFGISNNNHRIVSGLTPMDTCYVRFWIDNPNNYGSFDICLQNVPPPPVNDSCTHSIPLSINPMADTCTLLTVATTVGATLSTPNPSCTPIEHNDDVWYHFTATSQSIIVRMEDANNPLDNNLPFLSFALYNATCPASTSGFYCEQLGVSNNAYKIVSGLTIGDTYYLRLWADGDNNYLNFKVCVMAVPPPPINDDCAGSILLSIDPFGSTCTNAISVSTIGATESSLDVPCTPTENNDDVWFHFVATSQSVLVRANNFFNPLDNNLSFISMAIYQSAICPTSTATIYCDQLAIPNNGYRIINNLSIGQIYYLRLWTDNTNNFQSFELCIQEVPSPPVNDECTNALPLSIHPFGPTCVMSTSISTIGATESSLDVTCTPAENNDDIWYSFVAISSAKIFRVSNIDDPLTNSTPALSMAIYNTSVCPTTTTEFYCNQIAIINNSYTIINGFTIGNTYYVRLWGDTENNYITADFCIQQVPPPPANDECTGAIALAVTPNTVNCTSSIFVNTSGATLSTPNPSCTSNHHNDDVWYKFTATNVTHRIKVSGAKLTASNGNASISGALYATCPTGTNLVCTNSFAFINGTLNLPNLTIGNEYFIRLWAANTNNYASFNMCLQETPTNNDCNQASNVPVSNGFCTNVVAGTLLNATNTAPYGIPSCSPSGLSNDVWFKVTVPSTGNLIVQTSAENPTISNLIMEAYTGTCASSALLQCNDDGNPELPPSANHARIGITGGTPGEVLLFRVMPFNSANLGDFVICAWDTTSSVRPLVSDGGLCNKSKIVINSSHLNRYLWAPVFDSNNKIVAEVYSNGANLDTTTFSTYVNSGSVRSYQNKYFLDRNINITTLGSGTQSALIRLYLKQSEVDSLQVYDPTLTGISNLNMVISSDTCHAGYGIFNIPVLPTYQNYGSNHYAEFSQTGFFRSFYFESACGSNINWLGINSNWHDPQNWDCGGIPWKYNDVSIPSGVVNFPIIGQDADVRNLYIENGANVFTTPGIELKINGQ